MILLIETYNRCLYPSMVLITRNMCVMDGMLNAYVYRQHILPLKNIETHINATATPYLLARYDFSITL